MRHKLLYLLALALTATSSGWGQDVDTLVYSSGGKLCKMILPQTPSNPALESIPSCLFESSQRSYDRGNNRDRWRDSGYLAV